MLVTNGNVALSAALKACPLERLDTLTPDQFDALETSEMDTRQSYDVIVLDNHAPATLPRNRYLIFGRPPESSGVTTTNQLTNQVIVDWRARHPVLQFVDLSNFFASKSWNMTLPRDADVLAELASSPAIATVRRSGSTMVLVGFDVMQTNWPFEPGFVMFCYNAMNYLGMELGRGEQADLTVGQAITIESLQPNVEAKLSGPGLDQLKLRSDPSGMLRFPQTDLAGVYSIEVEGTGARHFAVNLLNAAESDIAPVRQITLSGQQIITQDQDLQRSNVELWPVLAMIALALVCLEWLVYNSRVRI